jgi:hypothetical protein
MINQSRDVAPLPVKPRAPLVPGQIFSTTTGASIDPSGGRRGFDFRHYWHSLVEKIWVVALCVVAGLFLGLGYLASTPKLYQGHTVLEVEMEEPSLIESDRASARGARDYLSSEQALRTIEQNLDNRTLMARVIHVEGLANDGGRAFLGKSVRQRERRPLRVRPAWCSISSTALFPTLTRRPRIHCQPCGRSPRW